MDRSRVLVFIKGLGIGGAEKLISEAAPYWDLRRFDYRVAYALPWKDQLVPELEGLGIPVTCVGTRRGLTPQAALRLRALIRREMVDLVHAHLPAAGVVARLMSPAPVVYTEHNLADSYRQPTRTLNRLTYRRNAATTTVSQAVADSVARFGGPSAEVVPNGVVVSVPPEAAAAARSELGLSASDPLVVHVGNVRPGKGHDTLIAAAGLMPSDITVVSIGSEKYPGDLNRIRQKAEAAGLTDRLRFLGRRSEARAFIAAADVYVNPAEVEGLPVSILEAMALGRPVVATAVGGVPSVVRHGETGLLVAPGDAGALATSVERILGHPGEGRRMADAGRTLVENEYGLERMVRAFEQIYREVLGD